MSERNSAQVAVVLLNFNGAEMLQRCVESLAGQTLYPERIVLVDNGSQDFDENRVRSAFGALWEKVRLLRLPTNLGYAKGMNVGLRAVLDDPHSPAWVMTLSNDTEMVPEFFEAFEQELERIASSGPDATMTGMLAPKLLSMNERNTLDGAGIGISLDGMSTARGQRERDDHQYDIQTDVLVPNGVAAIYRTALLRDVGLLDESFWAYCEDTDIGLRAWLAGWDCRFLPSCQVYHARSSSFGEFSLNKLYLVERNHYWVAVKNLPMPLLFLNAVFSTFRYALQLYAVASHRGQGAGYGNRHAPLKLAQVTARAILDAAAGIPRALKSRVEQRALRRRPQLEAMLMLWRKRMRFGDLILK